MRIRAPFFATALAVAALTVAAAPAGAHEEIHPSIVKTNTPTFFTLNAANEEKADLVKVVITAPEQVPLGGTLNPPTGWSSDATEKAVTFTAPSGGGVKPGLWAQFGFETDGAPTAGTYRFQVTLTFADGKSNPVVEVPVTVTTTGQDSGTAAATSSSDSGSGKATAALVLAIIGLVVALVAALLASRGRRPAAAEAGDSAARSW